MLKLQWNSFTF